jgi:hypothetical protein
MSYLLAAEAPPSIGTHPRNFTRERASQDSKSLDR